MKYLFLSLIFFTNLVLFSQDYNFSQIQQNQMIRNPSFTGVMYGPRLLSSIRLQYPIISNTINSGYNTYAISYDQFFRNANSGLGVQVIYDKMSDNILSRYKLEAMYSYQLKFNNYNALRVGISTNYSFEQFDYSQLKFFDQIDEYLGFNSGLLSNEDLNGIYNNSNFNSNFGLLYYTNNYYLGASINSILPFKKYESDRPQMFKYNLYSLQAGVYSNLTSDEKWSFILSGQFDYKDEHQKINQLSLLKYESFVFGLGFRHNIKSLESIILLAGYKHKNIGLNYSYDVSANSLKGFSGGSHEIGLRIMINGDDNSLKPNALKEITECPDFMKN